MRSFLMMALGLSIAFSSSHARAAKLEFRDSGSLASSNLEDVRETFKAAVQDSEQAGDVGEAMNLKIVAFKIVSKKTGETLETTIKQALHIVDQETNSVEIEKLNDPKAMDAAYQEVVGELSWNDGSAPDLLLIAVQSQVATSNPSFVVTVESNQTSSTLLVLVDQKTSEILMFGLEFDN